jgi:hypothetical protein
MKSFILATALIVAGQPTAFASPTGSTTKGVVVAFYDLERLRGRSDAQSSMDSFTYFLKPIQELVKRDFPDVEFRIMKRGDFLHLPDGTGLNIQNIQPIIGYVFSERGKKRRILSGPQSDVDFACAASAFFGRHSPTCPIKK